MDKGIQATPDEDDIVLVERNRAKAARELEFKRNSPIKPGYPTVDGLDIY